MPNVVFDLRSNNDTGVFRYGLSLLSATAPVAADLGWKIVVVVHAIQETRACVAIKGTPFRVEVCHEESGFVRRSQWLRNNILKWDIDLYFTSHYTVDRYCPVPFVFTIHDLTRLRFPNFSYTEKSFINKFGRDELSLLQEELLELSEWDSGKEEHNLFTRYFWALNQFLVQRAKRIITVSESTSNDIQKLLGVDKTRIDLVPCAVDTSIFRKRDKLQVETVRVKYNIPGPYLLFVGLTHPNKRFGWLVEQLIQRRWMFPADARLVVVGGHAEQSEELKAFQQGTLQDFIIFAGHVTDDTLAALYSGASAFVTASVNEGNNLPPLESLACGSPVIATDIPSLRETLANAANFYNLNNGSELASLVVAALSGDLRRQIRPFKPNSWSHSSQVLINSLQCALNQL